MQVTPVRAELNAAEPAGHKHHDVVEPHLAQHEQQLVARARFAVVVPQLVLSHNGRSHNGRSHNAKHQT